jgi:hypothetical protein
MTSYPARYRFIAITKTICEKAGPKRFGQLGSQQRTCLSQHASEILGAGQ